MARSGILPGAEGTEGYGPHLIDKNIYRPVSTGLFEGEDGREVISDAIAWWEHQMDEVDRRVGN